MVFDLFAELVAGGKTVLMVTQDEALAARMPRRIELSEGRVLRERERRPMRDIFTTTLRYKIRFDLLGAWQRTLQAIMTIAIGAFAVGTILGPTRG